MTCSTRHVAVAVATLVLGMSVAGCGDEKNTTGSRTAPPRTATVATPVARTTQAAAAKPCRKFNAEVKPLKAGFGWKALVRQARGFRAARAGLARDLGALDVSPTDRRLIDSYVRQLRANSALLDVVEREAKRERIDAAGTALDTFNRRAAEEVSVARRLALEVCATN